MSNPVPYASATSGHSARDEITKILRRLGCNEIGFMDNYRDESVVLYFVHRGRTVNLEASAKGWAAMFLKHNPYNTRKRSTRQEYERKAQDQGMIAVSSILRDWVKGLVTAIECGVLSFEAAFLPHMLTHDGKPLIRQIQNLLPPPMDEESE